jgi:hypothetical protein
MVLAGALADGDGHGQREVAADSIDAGHHHAQHRPLAADTAREQEPPDRRRQICVEPGLPELLRTHGDGVLQPAVPGIGEIARQSAADEIAARGQFAEEAEPRSDRDFIHRRAGHRNS